MAANPGLKRTRSIETSVSPPPVKRKQQSTTTQKAVSNFFIPASQKLRSEDKVTWKIADGSLLIGKYNATSTNSVATESANFLKIAAFDFDSTLITSASGLKFARDASDWKWWNPSVPTTLRRLHSEGFLVTILSNQAGLSATPDSRSKTAKTDLKRITDFKRKVTAVLTQLDIPMTIYAATAKDQYRKPRTGMWNMMLQDCGLLVPTQVNLKGSVFVGDAGGRLPSSTGASKDFSCSDRNLADNIGITFKTPEEFFLNEGPRPFLRDFDPLKYTIDEATDAPSASSTMFHRRNPTDIILSCGSPGAGKSTFYWNYLKPLGYERINQDILKSRDRCLQKAREYLSAGISVAIDNTNADPQVRSVWVSLAKEFNIPIRCILFTASAKLCEHNDAVRALNTSISSLNPEKRTMLPKMAFTGFTSRYREPLLQEGFQDITKVDFVFRGSEDDKMLWSKHWI